MKISYLLSLLLACVLPSPVKPTACFLLLRSISKEYEEEGFRCHQRLKMDWFRGGPGCRLSCTSKSSSCSDRLGVCGKARLRVGIYVNRRRGFQQVNEICLLPNGILNQHFHQYCFSLRVCYREVDICGCAAMEKGRHCNCEVTTVDGNYTIESDCEYLEGLGNFSAISSSEFEVESDEAFAKRSLNETYSIFMDATGPFQ